MSILKLSVASAAVAILAVRYSTELSANSKKMVKEVVLSCHRFFCTFAQFYP